MLSLFLMTKPKNNPNIHHRSKNRPFYTIENYMNKNFYTIENYTVIKIMNNCYAQYEYISQTLCSKKIRCRKNVQFYLCGIQEWVKQIYDNISQDGASTQTGKDY